jgi:16S rRNA (guanine1516-N2)-methyltransferase
MNNYSLAIISDRLALVANNKKIKPISIDFLSKQLIYRCHHGGGKKQLLAKAIGVTSKNKPVVIDTTAGLGVDAFILAKLGCEVYMLERSSIIAALLNDGLLRANQVPWFRQLKLHLMQTDAITYLKNLIVAPVPPPNHLAKINVIYLDPMYPANNKSALNSKEMRMLREVVGNDLDACELLAIALQCKKVRIVVKRPRLGTVLGNVKPTINFLGKSSRFDVYLT